MASRLPVDRGLSPISTDTLFAIDIAEIRLGYIKDLILVVSLHI
jgi:hypothetical protein